MQRKGKIKLTSPVTEQYDSYHSHANDFNALRSHKPIEVSRSWQEKCNPLFVLQNVFQLPKQFKEDESSDGAFFIMVFFSARTPFSDPGGVEKPLGVSPECFETIPEPLGTQRGNSTSFSMDKLLRIRGLDSNERRRRVNL